MKACARTGGVVNLNGIGLFLGNNDNSTDTWLRHLDYAVELIGPEHVGIGMDYVFDQSEMSDYIKARPDIFPPEKGYAVGMAMIEPERIPVLAEALLKRGYGDAQVRGIIGDNNLRIARQVWR
jgi:membrane dipeptidase